MADLERLRDGLWLLDTRQFGIPRYGGVYILRQGDAAALVETGTSLAAPLVLEGLEELGIARDAVELIFLTHIHLDHGGGAGELVRELPAARVVAHERGAGHLVDPTRLLSSVREAVGEKFPLYGTARPIPPERIEPVGGERTFRLGGLEVVAIPSPGHAPHHLCFFVPRTGELFTGDAAGLYLGGGLYPTTPPPSFDLERSLETLERLAAMGPKVLLYTHFGPGGGAGELLGRYGELLRWWTGKVASALESSGAGTAALEALLADPEVLRCAHRGDRDRAELRMNIRGVLGYLARREG
ncbi:MAG: MBL fold metallo-hydrolase [Caldiserica bacterium]|nr:MBL fold metallo-hydrolase [Caldisericota bacterium]